MDNQKEQWEKSYNNKNNFLFYPHEEVIRFVSKYIRKRIGFGEFKDIYSFTKLPKILDLGCGIGRHIIYAHNMGLDAYGIDLSSTAIAVALKWAKDEEIINPSEKIKQGDIRYLPWPDEYFDFVLSHGVLDSMPYEIAKAAIKEMARTMKKGGLFYCDLASGDDSAHAREYAGEEIVKTQHEQDTVQSYFNFSKVIRLIDNYFNTFECYLVRRENVLTGDYLSRYHLILKRK